MNWEDALWGLEQIVPRCRDVRGHMWNFSRGYAGCMRCDVVRGGMVQLPMRHRSAQNNVCRTRSDKHLPMLDEAQRVVKVPASEAAPRDAEVVVAGGLREELEKAWAKHVPEGALFSQAGQPEMVTFNYELQRYEAKS